MVRVGLDRSRIVQAAIAVLDRGGIEALTARGIAAELGVQAGALYYHLPDKRTLVDEVATQLLREMLAGGTGSGTWEAMLVGTADRVRTVLNAHRDGARVFAGSRILDPALLTAQELPLTMLTGAGLPLRDAVWILQTVLHYAVGFVIEEQHRVAEEPDGYDPAARREVLEAAAVPLAAAASEPMFADLDRQFAFGVELIVAGVRTRLP